MTIPSSRLANLKEYISQREARVSLPSRRAATPCEDVPTQARSAIQSLSKWAGQKIRRNTTDVTTVDEVHLFPGWAVKRPHSPTGASGEPLRFLQFCSLTVVSADTFDVDLHISGFATSRRTPEFLTRSQRAFLKLARSMYFRCSDTGALLLIKNDDDRFCIHA